MLTGDRQAVESLQHSQTLLRMAGRLTRVGAWSVELPGLNVTWSSEVRAIHEVPPGFVPTIEQAVNFQAPEFREAISRAFAACVRDATPFDLELQIVTASGRRVWMRTIGEAVRDADGRVTQVQGACQDISERKAAEAETRELAQQLTATLESLTDGFFTLDREWRFTYVNREAEKMLARPRAELLGHYIWAEFPEARDTISHQEYERALRDNVAVQFEQFYPPLGRWLEARAFPSTQGLAVHFRDITAVRQAGDALRASNEKFQLLADHITDAFWIRSADMRVVHYISPAFERIWGRSAESLYTNPLRWSEFTLAGGPRACAGGLRCAHGRHTKSGHRVSHRAA